MQVISSSLPPRFRVFQHPGYEHDGTITPAHLTTHQSVNPPISTTLPSSSPPPKKNDQKNPQGAIMATRQTIAPPTPPNVKINSSIPKKFSRKIGHIFPQIHRISFKITPRPQICTNCDNRDNQPTVGADLSRTPPIYRPARHHHHHRSTVGAD